jgi:hypothetical protein
MVIISLIISILASIGSFAWGYWQAGFESTAQWMLAFGAFWLFAHWQKWRWVASVWVVLAVLLGIVSVWWNVTFGWVLSGAMFAVFAWDLTEFQEKLKQLPPREDARGMTRRHLLRIGLLAKGALLIQFLFGWF